MTFQKLNIKTCRFITFMNIKTNWFTHLLQSGDWLTQIGNIWVRNQTSYPIQGFKLVWNWNLAFPLIIRRLMVWTTLTILCIAGLQSLPLWKTDRVGNKRGCLIRCRFYSNPEIVRSMLHELPLTNMRGLRPLFHLLNISFLCKSVYINISYILKHLEVLHHAI